MKTKIFFLFLLILPLTKSNAQGLNHNWLIGYWPYADPYTTTGKARIEFTTNSISIIPEVRYMAFEGAQANIADSNGVLQIVSNGCFVANGVGDTMINGDGLNPGIFTDDWCNSESGIPYLSNLLLDFPNQNNMYVLFHFTGNYSNAGYPTELYYSVIDVIKDSVILKNQIIINDKIGLGITACKQANGRDWWVVAFKDSSDYVYTIEVTPQGVGTPILQKLNTSNHNAWVNQPTFSPDGKQFAFHYYYGTINNVYDEVRLFDFDRCTGQFSNYRSITIGPSNGGLGLAFSPNSKQIYFCTFDTVYQLQTDSQNLQSSLQVVAINDGFYSPFPPFQTGFWTMYLAANGKIYISSGNGVLAMHYIDSPDVNGTGCNVQLHALPLPCWTFRASLNQPNYYLGCDTTLGCPCLSSTSLTENGQHDFRFRVYPNPVVNNFVNIGYILPQNKSGILKLYDVNGKQLYTQGLPPWSNEQSIKLPKLANGIYNLRIESGGYFMSKNLVVMNE